MDFTLNDADRLNLQKMIKSNEAEDYTDLIRQEKHSDLIREEVELLIELKKDFHVLALDNPSDFDELCVSKCQFLFNRYTDIFNKVKKDELDFAILFNFLDVLKQIENKEIDQHEGSVAVGRLLKKLYIDSALKKSEKLDELHKTDKTEVVEPINITWREFKLGVI